MEVSMATLIGKISRSSEGHGSDYVTSRSRGTRVGETTLGGRTQEVEHDSQKAWPTVTTTVEMHSMEAKPSSPKSSLASITMILTRCSIKEPLILCRFKAHILTRTRPKTGSSRITFFTVTSIAVFIFTWRSDRICHLELPFFIRRLRRARPNCVPFQKFPSPFPSVIWPCSPSIGWRRVDQHLSLVFPAASRNTPAIMGVHLTETSSY
ncbi:hypothetical protein AUP68_04161 [Ilyonectria robusta]